jgi:hypothetical protein
MDCGADEGWRWPTTLVSNSIERREIVHRKFEEQSVRGLHMAPRARRAESSRRVPLDSTFQTLLGNRDRLFVLQIAGRLSGVIRSRT